jgi:hypothetical protein
MRQKDRADIPQRLMIGLLASVAAATAAQVTPIGAPTPASETLKKLHDCFSELRKQGKSNYVSPCSSMTLTNLSGIHLDVLTAALGAPTFCTKPHTIDAVPSKACVAPAWSFYYLPKGWVGGGPELVCSTDDSMTCGHVEWVDTQ